MKTCAHNCCCRFFLLFIINFVLTHALAANAWANHYIVTYNGRTYDAVANETTFSYTVSGTGQSPALSHAVAGIPQCNPALNVVDSSPQADSIQLDPPTGIYGVKWDFGIGINDTLVYSYTVSGNVIEGTNTFAVKAGRIVEFTTVPGASCAQCAANEGDVCSAGVGICANDGTVQCDGSCDATPGNPDPNGELCSDGLDNNCDGSVDEIICDGCPSDPNKTSPGLCGCGVADTDSDNDGTPDCNDTCPTDPNKTQPGTCGCNQVDTDTDLDGTADCNDACPIDPTKISSGVCGCGVADTDSDNDGTPDCNDTCPTDPNKTQPGTCGCNQVDTDTDLDGVADCNDTCPTDPGKTSAGLCGCGVADTDSDNDGTPDCNDTCPADPGKAAPGVCGCGIPDTDSDGDGTPDCNDSCPTDANKLIPGTCGCNVADVDSDSDGTLDCLESCPTDPNKLNPGVCGCNIADVDTDLDQVLDCIDSCPIDSAKITPGLCGCNVADTDLDQDGRPDCNDSCPNNPAKVQPGVCGCNTADVDSDGDGVLDCNDACAQDKAKTVPGSCGCGIADADADVNGVLDCNEDEGDCGGLCVATNPGLDEDGDGKPNCVEIEDGTDVCDSGSFKERLEPFACAGPNGFFLQTNILTIINRQTDRALEADVVYRDLFGTVQGQVSVLLQPEQKQDLIVNDLGLLPDTYGTVCVTTNAEEDGAWSGGLTLYKERFDLTGNAPLQGLSPNTVFDYALYYPLVNPQSGLASVPLNTNSLGTEAIPDTQIANWVRLTDAVPGDGKRLKGTLRYYDIGGKLVGEDIVDLPDGGRFDFSGHEKIGQNQVGLAQFEPKKGTKRFYVESSRYVYEGMFAETGNFWTAYVIPNRAPTGVPTSGRISTLQNEIAIVELTNAAANDINASFQAYDASGTKVRDEAVFIPSKGTRHLIITGEALASGFSGSAEVSGPSESIKATTLVYRFNPESQLLLAFAPSFIEPISKVLRTEFNSFIGHINMLELTNTKDTVMDVAVRILNFDASLLDSFAVKLDPRATKQFVLTLPPDTYGTIVSDSGATSGIVLRNDMSRIEEYAVNFPGQ